MPAVSFELLHQIKELQLQHGLRTDDFQRYHAHCTSRIRTLRKQLKLASDYKGATAGGNNTRGGGRNAAAKASVPVPYVAPKAVTATNAASTNHILLMTLLVERALAEAGEASAAAAGSVVRQQQTGKTRHVNDGGRKRLNKAKSLAADLSAVANAVGDDRLKLQVEAYTKDVAGRCHLAHERYEDARANFTAARQALVALRPSSSQQLWEVAVNRIIETDDRLVFAAQHLGQTYKAPAIEVSAGKQDKDSSESTKYAEVQWLGRAVPVLCLPVKQSLRVIDTLNAEVAAKAFLAAINRVEKERGRKVAAWAAFQQSSLFNKTVDGLDRTVAALNDALDAVQHDMREASSLAGGAPGAQTDRTKALRLLQLYLNFNVQRYTVLRTELVTCNFRARFQLSLELLERPAQSSFRLQDAPNVAELCPELARFTAPSGKAAANAASTTTTNKQAERKQRRELAFAVQHVASPPEIERLCDTTIRVVGDALLLPGVEDNAELSRPLEASRDLATAHRDYYAAEGWLIAASRGAQSSAAGAADAARQKAAALLARVIAHCRTATAFDGAELWTTYAEALLASIAAGGVITALTSSGAAAPVYSPANVKELIVGGAKAGGSAAAGSRAAYVADAPGEFVPCDGFAQFPPSFRSMPAKPAFVDVAATYLDFPEFGDTGSQAPTAAAPAPLPTAAERQQQRAADEEQQESDEEPAAGTAGAAQAEASAQPAKKGGWGLSRLWGR